MKSLFKSLTYIIIAIVFIFTAACGGGGGGNSDTTNTNDINPAPPAIPVTGVNLLKSATGMLIGGTETFYAGVFPATATIQTVTWKSDNTNIATVDSNGKVTGKAAGEAIITATADDHTNGTISATCKVQVSATPIQVDFIIFIAAASTRVIQGSSLPLAAVIIPDNATNQSVHWESSDESIATAAQLGYGSCLVNGLTAGNVTITAIADDDSNGAMNAINLSVGNYKIFSGTFSNWSSYKPDVAYMRAAIFDDSNAEWCDLTDKCYFDLYGDIVLFFNESVEHTYLTEATSAVWQGGIVNPASGIYLLTFPDSGYKARVHIYDNSDQDLADILYATTGDLSLYPNSFAQLQYASGEVTISSTFTEEEDGNWICYSLDNVAFPAGWSWVIFTTIYNSGAANIQADPGYTVKVTSAPFTNLSGFKLYGGDF